MTAQIPDTVRVDGQVYDLVAARGHGLFDPAAHGLAVVMASTAAWRGYVCAYELAGDLLRLDRLDAMVGRYVDDLVVALPLPPIHGRPGEPGRDMFNALYTHLALPIAFTGELVLGADRTGEPVATVEPSLYRHLLNLRFRDGRLVVPG